MQKVINHVHVPSWVTAHDYAVKVGLWGLDWVGVGLLQVSLMKVHATSKILPNRQDF